MFEKNLGKFPDTSAGLCSRRKFLLGSGIFAASYLFYHQYKLQKYKEDYPDITENKIKLPPNGKNVIIIGAGLSGLMTGCDLIDRGFSVTILEKNNLPGGRLLSWEDSQFLPQDQKSFIIEHATHGIWSSYNNFREFLSRHEIHLREKPVNTPYSAFSVVHPGGDIKDLSNGIKWPSLFYTYNETGNFDFSDSTFKFSQIMQLLSFDPKDPNDVQRLDDISMYDWCMNNNIPQSTIENFVDPLLKMSNFSDSKTASALAWFRHTSNSFGHWKDLSQIQFFKNSPDENLIAPLVKYIKDNGGNILYNHPVTDIKTNNEQIVSFEVKSEGEKFACPICGHIHDHNQNQCDKCGHIGNLVKTAQYQKSFSGDYYLIGVDIPSFKKLFMDTGIKDDIKLKSINLLEPMKVIVIYMAFLKSDQWPRKLSTREVFFSSGFKTIATVLNINYQKTELLNNSKYDVYEIQIPADENQFRLKDSQIIELVMTDFNILFPTHPKLENYRVLRWDNFSGERKNTEKNSLNFHTKFENLFLLGDHIKIEENAQFMEKVSIVSKKVINHLLELTNIKEGQLTILESETPDILVNCIRKLASPV